MGARGKIPTGREGSRVSSLLSKSIARISVPAATLRLLSSVFLYFERNTGIAHFEINHSSSFRIKIQTNSVYM